MAFIKKKMTLDFAQTRCEELVCKMMHMLHYMSKCDLCCHTLRLTQIKCPPWTTIVVGCSTLQQSSFV